MIPIDALTVAMSDNEEFIADLTNMDKKKLISLANLAARTIPSLMAAERLSRGMPTEIVSGVVEHQHVKVVERDQIGAVLEILGQAGVLNVGIPDSGSPDIVDATVVEVHSVPAESDD
jgi:diadenosine tetraphosphate (Ap4A) HIT family hydrolase